jgi:hypothetical protein
MTHYIVESGRVMKAFPTIIACFEIMDRCSASTASCPSGLVRTTGEHFGKSKCKITAFATGSGEPSGGPCLRTSDSY